MEYTDDAKAAFAAFLFKNPNDPFGAAKHVLGNSVGVTDVATMAHIFKTDPFVLSEMKRIAEAEQNEDTLPSKADLAREIWDWVTNSANEIEDKIKAAKLYAEIRGYIDKPAAPNTNPDIVPSVMVVREHGNSDEWEKKMREQQDKLTNGQYTAKQSAKS